MTLLRLATLAAFLAIGPAVYSEDSNDCEDCIREKGCDTQYDLELQRCSTRNSTAIERLACESDAQNAYYRCQRDARRQCTLAKRC